MAIIKLLFILVGGVVLLIVGGGWGIAHYVVSTPPVQFSEADLKPGAQVKPAEREAFTAACVKQYAKKFGAKAQNACACVTSFADANFSRHDRLMATAAFSKDVTASLSLAKGLLDLELSDLELKQVGRNYRQRLDASEARCTRGMI